MVLGSFSMALSKWRFIKVTTSGNFPNVQFPKWQLPKDSEALLALMMGQALCQG